MHFFHLFIIIVLLNATVLPRSYFFLCLCLLAMFSETDVKLYCTWSSFIEMGQAHYK